ncbi:MAG: di-heme oxidoredictase family protein [Bacteroidota bacterium]
MKKGIVLCTAIVVILAGCRKNEEEQPLADQSGYETGEEYSADVAGTVFDASVNAFNNSIPGLSLEENIRFTTGNSFNRSAWVIAPSSTEARDGLGPVYNAASCSGCHRLDGRGRPPEPGTTTISMVYRISLPGEGPHGEPLPVTDFGDQLNHRSIPGVDNEGDVDISYTEVAGVYPDGTPYSLRKPNYQFRNGALNGVLYSPRVAPKMTGAGYFDALSAASILVHADPDDLDHDGISGRPNYVWDYTLNSAVLGKIGWKASQPDVKQQIAHAFLNDIGITSSIFPDENLWGIQQEKYGMLTNGGNPEIRDSIFRQVLFYTDALAMPARRNVKDANVLAGKKSFNQLGCVKCHVSKFTLGVHPVVPQLSHITIRPYSDLLLHDMGPDLTDNRPDYLASGREWRTSPLWGIGLYETVNGHTLLLHDGRARGVEEAILWHGGEAAGPRNSFMLLSKSDRNNVIAFIKSL